MNPEMKKIVGRMKVAQTKLQSRVDELMTNQDWLDEAKKYAERAGTDVKKLISSDVTKVKTFVDRQRKELERVQKQLPAEVKRFQKLLNQQRTELEKMIRKIRLAKKTGASSGTKKRSTSSTKKATSKKSAS
jgi:uncharacterized membrane protein YqiK